MDVSKLKVLILDDSNVVLSSMRGMLSKIGFNEKSIFFSQSPKTGISIAKREVFDLVICDYNFYSTLDGKQVFEEMKHFDCLKSDALFVVITGDSSLETVNALVELEPDDYLLKPFNQSFLKTRVIQGLKRKQAMKDIYVARALGDFSQGIVACDQILPFFPSYYTHIMREKGRFLRLMLLWEQAQSFYSELSASNDSDWVKLGMSNSMKNLGEINKARKVVESILERNPNNVSALKEIASIEVLSHNIPASITHLQAANNLTKGNSERELVISNLSLSVGDYSSSLDFYKKYVQCNNDTFRSNNWMKINLIRRMLMQYSENQESASSLLEIERLMAELLSIDQRSKDLQLQIDIISAHVLLVQGKYDDFVSLLNSSYKITSKGECRFHFYDVLYFVWLLSHCSYDNECKKISLMLIKAFENCVVENKNDLNSEIILDSMKLLMESILEIEGKKSTWLNNKYNLIKGLSRKESLPVYIEISKRYPTLVSVRTKIVEYLGDSWPEGFGKNQVRVLLKQSDDIIRQLSDNSELKKTTYNQSYNKALSSINGKKALVTQ
ncbi:response regulator [Vibrio crassostreae]|uniref:response regulator n=1 Tax=Vibrio crassostreae TaxID=246167 RepID=UPI000F4722C2|nr:response regulator [Vibrio crassostreae]ROO77092.1 response regulator receiver domain-containing protein [Vibrio crassostreae]ROR75337.1 response regulator receiver domain-containing protein [Vibrio crassostreae]TCV32786.1 response regulator receiver domain-containing protein [Vibrio crassostreae]